MQRALLSVLIVGGTAAIGAYALGTSKGSTESPAGRYDLGGGPAWQTALPAELMEISGIAFTPDGRLFAHGDEDGTLWELDGRSGTIRKRFSIAAAGSEVAAEKEEEEGRDGDGKKGRKGKKPEPARSGVVVADFEDLAIVGDTFFLVTSSGRLYQFAEGSDGSRVPHTVVRTGLEERCEVEGLAYDRPGNALMLLCKQELPKKSAPARVAVYAWSLDDARLTPEPRLQVGYDVLADLTGSARFNGSAMTLVPETGALMVVAGPQKAFAEITTAGKVVAAGSLDPSAHRQPEGLAFAPDGTLLIADEGAGEQPTLTAYQPKAASR